MTITYRIRSRALDYRYTTAVDTADPELLAAVAVDRATREGGVQLGHLIEVSGGRFGRPGGMLSVYVSTAGIARRLGCLAWCAVPAAEGEAA